MTHDIDKEIVFTSIKSAENDLTSQKYSSPAVVTAVKSEGISSVCFLLFTVFFSGLFLLILCFQISHSSCNVSFKSRVLNRTGESFDSELYNRIGVAGCLVDAYGLQATVTGAKKHLNVFIICK